MIHNSLVSEKCGVHTPVVACCMELSASKGKEKVVKMRLDKGADVNLKSKTGTNALMFAAVGRHAKVMGLLKSKGAQ